MPLCDSPSAGSTSMDWVKVDETTGEDSRQSPNPEGEHVITQSENVLPAPNPPNNFDDYSFGSSDNDGGDDEEEDNGLDDMAWVSLDTPFDMGILQSSIEKSKDALDLVIGKEVVMVVGKTG